jgi:hypothetical protein
VVVVPEQENLPVIGDGLTITAIGPATANGRISLSELARIASGFQATLERIAFSIVGGRRRPGRRPQEIANAVRFDFAGFRTGSAVLDLRRPTGGGADDLLSESFDALVNGVSGLNGRTDHTPPPHFTPAVINGLVTLCGGINSNNITRIEFASGTHVFFTADERMQRHLKQLRKVTHTQEISIVGRLHMGDFDPLSLRCRIDTYAGSISCDFDDELKGRVFELLDELVLATGTAEFQTDGTSIRVLHLSDLAMMSTANTNSLDELAREQDVTPISGIEDLRGEIIDDFDEFLRIVRSAR